MNLLTKARAAVKGNYTGFIHRVSPLREHPSIVKIIGVALVSLIIGFIIAPVINMRTISRYHEGDIAKQTLYSPQDIEAADVVGTENNTEKLIRGLPPIFRYNPFVRPRMYSALITIFVIGRNMLAAHRDTADIIKAVNSNTSKVSGLSVSPDAIAFLCKKGFSRTYEDALLGVIQKFYDRYKVIGNDTNIQDYSSTGIVLITPGIGRLFIHDINNFVDVQDTKNIMFDYISEAFPFISMEDHITLTDFLISFIAPDVKYNRELTENTIAKVRASIKPATMHLKKGELIVREGERIDSDIFAKLKVLGSSEVVKKWYVFVLFYAAMFFIVIFSVLEFSQKNIRKFHIAFKDGVFLSVVLIMAVLTARLSTMLTGVSEIGSFSIPQEAYYYAAPIAFTGMIVRLILNSEIAIGFSIVAGLAGAITVSNNVFVAVYYIISGVVGAHMLAKCEQRSSIIKGGLVVSGVNILLVGTFMIIQGNQPANLFIVDISMAFLNGISSAVLVTGLTPVFESVFGYVTDIKLLELANLENPLLKDLFVTAPGSYSHSMMTATLAETAAASIHANPLLTRVASYYHDIGKIRMPDYFIENQQYMTNKHDKLSPSMSSLIIISHVKEGKELAKANKIPQKIIDIIMQHHGTSLVKYFYEKAKEKNGTNIQEEEYHYPGPKPQTREAGIVMLADAVEAASRTLTESTPAQIKAMVEKIVNARFVDGQLDECTLALSDLNEIKKSFAKVLSAIFHKRVDYPGFTFHTAPAKPNGYSNIVQIQKK
ncbi:MAG: HDIG domain-containing protein [Deltaproteobacteria bacterium]|nr:HDIG domain-containing protein [Deltaproteobacteria bacterium]MCL5277387.1 HDIG domain-containing protein [Deltaproteobacteria bacterium]